MFDEYSQYYDIIISKQVVVVGQQVSVSQSWSKRKGDSLIKFWKAIMDHKNKSWVSSRVMISESG